MRIPVISARAGAASSATKKSAIVTPNNTAVRYFFGWPITLVPATNTMMPTTRMTTHTQSKPELPDGDEPAICAAAGRLLAMTATATSAAIRNLCMQASFDRLRDLTWTPTIV